MVHMVWDRRLINEHFKEILKRPANPYLTT
jgi:hypothetical protein